MKGEPSFKQSKNDMHVPEDSDDEEEDGDVLRRLGDDMPPFPAELIKSGEPVLLVKEGQLIQLQKKREDGWAYGLVVFEPEATADDRKAEEVKALMEKLKGLQADEAARSGGGGASGKVMPVIGAMEAKLDGQIDEEDLGGVSAGWLPLEFTRDPTPKEMKTMQDAMGGKAGVDALSPPSNWSSDPDPLNAKIVPLERGSDEYIQATEAFRKTLDRGPGVLPNTRMSIGPPCPDLNIKGVSRIENLGLWQSYAAKKQSLLTRAKAEGLDSSDYEVKWSYHGCGPDVVPLIIQRGFNRSFCGKNATFFGKGVYFARDASYSAHPTYARPDSTDTQRIFLCRTLKGEVCKGVRDGLTPDIRVPSNGTLYDSTTNNMADPIMWVTYHDAQAYPEYVVEFRVAAYN